MSAGRGTGTAIPGLAVTSPPRTTPTASTRNWRRSGPGRRSTPRSRRSWSTSGSWPTATGCALTSSFPPPSPLPAGTSRSNGGGSRPAAGRRSGAGTTSWPPAAFRCPSHPTSKAPAVSPGRSTSPAAGRTRALTSRASGSRSSAPARRASSPSRSSPARPASSRSSSAPPNFSIPAHNGPAPADRLEQLAEDRDGYRHAARWSRGGIPIEPTDVLGVTASEAVRRERFEAAWEQGELFGILNVFADQGVNPASNDIVAEMIREKIRSVVRGSRDRRGALPEGPLLRHQAAVPRYRLLRDLQPAARPARRPAQAADRQHHRGRHRDGGRVVRLRRHRVRHRLRRHDRRPGGRDVTGRDGCPSRRSGRPGRPRTWGS